MPEAPANPNIAPRRYSPFWFRFFEILPGGCVWLALLLPFLLSVIYPLSVTIFIIIFDVYWLVQAFDYGFILIKGYRCLRRNLSYDWISSLNALNQLNPETLEREQIIDWQEIYHAVILTTYKEQLETLEASIRSIQESDYPQDKIIVVVATEARAGEQARKNAEALTKKFGQQFFRFIVTTHPDNIVGEVKAKGANASWAARELTKVTQKLGLDHEQVVVSTADADSRFDKNYFGCLSFAYATNPNRTHCSYQPIATYFNNIWQAPLLSRVLAFGDTFWVLVESVRNYRLITFATHAMSLQTLVDIDYWCTSVVNEDSRQFFRAFFRYEGDFTTIPLFIPIYMDAVHTGSFSRTLKNLYLQKQRWAYGVEHFPYIVLESFYHRRIPFLRRFMLIWRALQGSFSWATSSFFISIIGWLPILLNVSFRNQVVVSNFTLVTNLLLSLTWFGLLVSSVITLRILTILPHKKASFEWAKMILQWALVPIAGLVFSALPGLHAQTRLMLGQYLGFQVTEKAYFKPDAE